MKKKHLFTLTSLGLLALLSCIIVFHLSCNPESDCSGCYLTNDELAFICYSGGEKVIFKNDITNNLDTLFAEIKAKGISFCSSPCNNGAGSITEWFNFSNLAQFTVGLYHEQSPIIHFNNDYVCILNVPTQTVIVNGITYNDVYSVMSSPDSTTIISNGDQLTVPWKIYYSKSQGFVRFYMVNGQTWSKL